MLKSVIALDPSFYFANKEVLNYRVDPHPLTIMENLSFLLRISIKFTKSCDSTT